VFACVPGELHLWRLDLRQQDLWQQDLWQRDIAASGEQGGMFWPLLSQDERERAARFRFRKDRNNFVAARGGLRLVLSRYTGVPAAELVFSYGDRGKPALVNGGAVPGLAFNATHSGAYAVYAVGNGCHIGVDVERIRPDVHTDDLAVSNFSAKELGALRALPPGERAGRFFALWTCKEAYVKACGGGLFIPLDSFHVMFGADGGVRLEAADGPWQLRTFSVNEGYPAAVAHDGGAASYRFYELEPASHRRNGYLLSHMR
jgi:4'-phosphopantetheinyl transferase